MFIFDRKELIPMRLWKVVNWEGTLTIMVQIAEAHKKIYAAFSNFKIVDKNKHQKKLNMHDPILHYQDGGGE